LLSRASGKTLALQMAQSIRLEYPVKRLRTTLSLKQRLGCGKDQMSAPSRPAAGDTNPFV
jgi:hypothetical protein